MAFLRNGETEVAPLASDSIVDETSLTSAYLSVRSYDKPKDRKYTKKKTYKQGLYVQGTLSELKYPARRSSLRMLQTYDPCFGLFFNIPIFCNNTGLSLLQNSWLGNSHVLAIVLTAIWVLLSKPSTWSATFAEHVCWLALWPLPYSLSVSPSWDPRMFTQRQEDDNTKTFFFSCCCCLTVCRLRVLLMRSRRASMGR